MIKVKKFRKKSYSSKVISKNKKRLFKKSGVRVAKRK